MRSLLIFSLPLALLPLHSFSSSGAEELLTEEYQFILSATKKKERVETAPSNFTVITAQRIKELGLRNLRDVFSIVPGYFNAYDRDEWVPTSRGVTSDNSLQYMLLLDGQDITNMTAFGVSGAFEMPNDLSNVKQIEVIRGPGSVVWGGSSLGGVINIVTKTTSDLKKDGEVTLSAGTENTQKLSFLSGKELNADSSYLLSGAIYRSDGDEIETDASTNLPVFFQNYGTGADPWGRFKTDVDRFDPSYRLHLKGRSGRFYYAGYGFRNKVFNRQFETDGDRLAWIKHRNYFASGGWKIPLTEGTGHLDLRFSMGSIGQSYYIEKAVPLLVGKSSPTYFTQDYDYRAINMDARNSLVPGTLGVEWGAEVIDRDFFNALISPASLNTDLSPATGRIEGIDNDLTSGLYAVTLYNPIESLTLLAGGRMEHNPRRGHDKLIFTPRVGIIWEVSRSHTLKALYNTGYRRPTYERKSFPAETLQQVEMIWIGKIRRSSLTVTAYWQQLSDLLALSQGGLTTGGSQTFISGGKETAKGLEIEGDTLVFDRLKLWTAISLGQATAGDYPVAPTTLPETDAQRVAPGGDKLGYLSRSVAGGATIHLTDSVFMSPSARHLGAMDVRLLPPTVVGDIGTATYGKTRAITYLDLNLGFEPRDKNYAVFLYGNNIGNVKKPLPHAIRNGTRQTYGAYYEVKWTYSF